MTHPTACPCLWIAEPYFPEPDGFLNLWFHGYLLICPEGNPLIHTIEHEQDHDAIAELDGVSPQHLAHGYEAEQESQRSDNASGAHYLLIVRLAGALLLETNDGGLSSAPAI
ncbi:hypothetical protein GCM10011499_35610 [Pelagibacterium lentulum]|uniref:Uncharacterized protein n=1 Tax=Pelagibacterium lentulum TaxID=2029865 RepID=A0A916W2H7_9HYPH|nr:hypothetical protein GCM10011499_35610 [Pelagibacterium lentulum]